VRVCADARQVGSGKSSLISAMLGHMTKKSGQVEIVDSIAYVAQQAWIQNATVKNNILFGKEMDFRRYNSIV
jgi:ABC-type transport system involved in cytochrome bd biosynthesis fused ATPase/permease subunit